MTSLLPPGEQTFLSAAGLPLAGGTVTLYVPGTTTLKNTWKDPQSLALNTNPIVLDAAGRAIIYGSGQYRIVVQDSLGNLQYDQTTASNDFGISLTSLGVSAPLATFVQSSTLKVAANSLLLQGDHLAINNADQTLTVAPTANTLATISSVNVQGVTRVESPREFLVNLGLTSQTGSTQNGSAIAGKVTLYSGLDAKANTGDIWTFNSCLTQEAGSGNYNAQGYELDFNNFNVNRGASGLITSDFTAPVSWGLSLTGAGTKSSTGALLIVGGNTVTPQWNRGITFSGKMGICSVQDAALVPVCIQMDGIYSVAAINLTAVYGNAGASSNGLSPNLTALFMKNLQTITWQDTTTLHPISDTVDATNNRIIGVGATSVSAGADFTAPNLRMPNLGALTWARTGALSGGSPYCFDYVDALNNRNVGFNSSSVVMGNNTIPITPGLTLGTAINYWGATYYLTGAFNASDINLKNNVTVLPTVMDTIKAVNPIKFNWKDDKKHGAKTHWGFDADHIKTAFDKIDHNFAGYHQAEDGSKWIAKDNLIPVLWKGIQELSELVTSLTERVKLLEAN